MTKKQKTIVLIDGNALIHRAYHALPPLTTSKGETVQAVYGFAMTLLSVLYKVHGEAIAATVYRQPGPRTQQAGTIALDDPMTVTYPPAN